jgi:hypothetical protein
VGAWNAGGDHLVHEHRGGSGIAVETLGRRRTPARVFALPEDAGYWMVSAWEDDRHVLVTAYDADLHQRNVQRCDVRTLDCTSVGGIPPAPYGRRVLVPSVFGSP